MGKALIIAEKPSVARDIAAALGNFKKGEDNTFERDDAVVANARGHLVGLVVPEGVDKGWEFSALPLIPESFALEALSGVGPLLATLRRLSKRSDIDTIINACDAGREGELIFRLIYQFLGCKKPIKRMWLQSMTPEAIAEAYRTMRTDEQMKGLDEAARCRNSADWIMGINGTRAMSKLWEHIGGAEGVASCGRVQTPTLALLYYRELAIKNFVPRDYWEVHGIFKAAAGSYEGKWFDPKFQKGDDVALKAERLFDYKKAQEIEAKCAGCDPSSVTEESKPTSSLPGKLFDLTTLQREANNKFGFTASETLEIAQALYETHKVLTYPRTDATALPEDYVPTAKATLASFAGSKFGAHADLALKSGWVKPNKRIFDNSKISDHFAIIPNGNKPGNLSPGEAKIYDLVTKRFIAVFYPAAEFLQTTRTTTVAGELFKSHGTVLVSEGWLAVYGRDSSDDNGKSLCPLTEGEAITTESIKVKGSQTTPPERYTDSTLLGAMENAGRTIEDDEAAEALKGCGLGTPATRAATIEDLLKPQKNYMRRDKKFLVPTEKAMSVIALLLNNGVAALTSAKMTGDWEHKLTLIEQRKLSAEAFMEGIKAETRAMVENIRQKARTTQAAPGTGRAGSAATSGVTLKTPCPKCKGGTVGDSGKMFACQTCDFKIWKEIAGRTLKLDEAETLLATGSTATLSGFISNAKKPFSAKLKLAEGFDKVSFVFDNEPVDPASLKSLATCPKCHSKIVENGKRYSCENAMAGRSSCNFGVGMTIASKNITQTLLKSLITKRRTDLVTGFVSRANKTFEAHLVLNDDFEVVFEFPERKKT